MTTICQFLQKIWYKTPSLGSYRVEMVALHVWTTGKFRGNYTNMGEGNITYLCILEYNNVTGNLGGLRRGCRAIRLIKVQVRILPEAWMSVSCECCVVKDRSLQGAYYSSRSSPAECSVSEVFSKCQQ